jgi:hypothetical protein
MLPLEDRKCSIDYYMMRIRDIKNPVLGEYQYIYRQVRIDPFKKETRQINHCIIILREEIKSRIREYPAVSIVGNNHLLGVKKCQYNKVVNALLIA